MYILGLNAYHGDSSACLVRDGELLCAIEEERLRRVKHWAGLPTEAVRFCLETAGITLDQIDYIGISRNPRANFWKKVIFAVSHGISPRIAADRVRNLRKVSSGIVEGLATEFKADANVLRKKLIGVEHHRAHISSAFFVSPFEEAAVLSVDGMGDFVSTMWGSGKKNLISPAGKVEYPHSLGFVYTALTQYLGFWKYGDEYKVMGLSGFGTPRFLPELKKLVQLTADGFRLNLDYFIHQTSMVSMSWENREPQVGKMYGPRLEKMLGPARRYEDPITKDHEDIAASLQALYEEVFFHLLDNLHTQTKSSTLTFAGGTAQNSVGNGKILANSAFREVYIPPAGHDAGTAIGAAFYIWNQVLGESRGFIMRSPFWGQEFKQDEVRAALQNSALEFEELDDTNLFSRAAKLVAEGNIVGWFQGKTEWGPRALGNRSIVANPALPEIKERMNLKIKKREPFRPFAPSILEEKAGEYFEQSDPVPFMEKVYVIKEEMRAKIPAVVHVDGTGRLQTVSKDINPRYWRLIDEVGKITGVPIVLNTSFNENEPIVNRPQEAIDCYLRTKMDALVLGNFIVVRNEQ